jgi:hypothetical protein
LDSGGFATLSAQKPELSLTLSVGLFLGMIAETYNHNKVRHADVSVPPGTEPPPYAFLDPFFGRFGKRAVEMFSAYSKMERLAFRMNASCTAKRAHRSQIAR